MKRNVHVDRRYLRRLITTGLFVLLAGGAAIGASQNQLTRNVTDDPMTAVFEYQDVENFISAHEAITSGADPAEALKLKYFDRASPGLRMFVEKYELTVERLLEAMQNQSEKYSDLRETLKNLREEEPAFRQVYVDLNHAIPDAVFPPTYFLVGGYRGIGSGSIEGPLLSIEKETSGSIKEDLDATLCHEMIHMQQLAAVGEAYFAIFSGDERTLLALSIREGAATFFAELITGGSEHKNLARDHYLAHEKKLWEAFRDDMLGHETGDWLWRTPTTPDQPRDIGYAIGARIVGTFYNSAGDKRKASREIMGITDYPAFLARSGYPERMDQISHPD